LSGPTQHTRQRKGTKLAASRVFKKILEDQIHSGLKITSDYLVLTGVIGLAVKEALSRDKIEAGEAIRYLIGYTCIEHLNQLGVSEVWAYRKMRDCGVKLPPWVKRRK